MAPLQCYSDISKTDLQTPILLSETGNGYVYLLQYITNIGENQSEGGRENRLFHFFGIIAQNDCNSLDNVLY